MMKNKLKTIMAIGLSCFGPQLFQDASAQVTVNCGYFENIIFASGSRSRSESMNFNRGTIIKVTNPTEARSALRDRNIDTIIFGPGRYPLGTVILNRHVTLYSEIEGGAIFPKDTLLDIRSNYTAVNGFRFEEGAKVGKGTSRDHSIYVRADDVRLQHNSFFNVGIGSTIADKTGIAIEVLNANDTIITDNTFTSMRGIAIKSDDASRNLIIAHNNFLNSYAYGGFGEIAHIGNANSLPNGLSPTPDDVGAKITRNYVRNWQLESELVSLKSNKNEVSFNFIENASSGAFVVRMGNDNHIHSNIMLGNNTYPLRISGARNLFEYNFFVGTGSLLALHEATPSKQPLANLHYDYLAAQNNLVKRNVFTGYETVMSPKEKIMQSTLSRGNQFSENVILSSRPQRIFEDLQKAQSTGRTLNHIQSDTQKYCASLFEIEK